MAERTGIEWSDRTWSPWGGCQAVSAACDHCYAEAMDRRTGHANRWGPHGAREDRVAAYYLLPAKWNAEAQRLGRPISVFPSMCDPFDNHRSIRPEWRLRFWSRVRYTPYLRWLVLTKRPQNIFDMLPPDWGAGWPNVWLGATVENQEEADRRIPHLLRVRANVHFLSCEPLLGPIDLTRINGVRPCDPSRPSWIDWVIVGGESGPRARPMHPDWARSLRDQCVTRGVPFFFKQWGEWAPNQCEQADYPDPEVRSWAALEGRSWQHYTHDELTEHVETPLSDCVARYGKKRAGNLLDGVAHRQFPDA